MIIGCYVLHVRCTFVNHNNLVSIQEEFTGETAAQTYKSARDAGWRLDLKHSAAFCPYCLKKGKELKQ